MTLGVPAVTRGPSDVTAEFPQFLDTLYFCDFHRLNVVWDPMFYGDFHPLDAYYYPSEFVGGIRQRPVYISPQWNRASNHVPRYRDLITRPPQPLCYGRVVCLNICICCQPDFIRTFIRGMSGK
ncbi:hypothetical protein AVEN_10163-1 [Araneus ventricosus]|uniref:Uncharacterized protein n=1 Tax=Araneus ventricosus TaxID=182803 RepID=A0A4Y2MN66_ARAVE|nr:hypothetical protein AVEN_10163-1 [Araneus ventricosus]